MRLSKKGLVERAHCLARRIYEDVQSKNPESIKSKYGHKHYFEIDREGLHFTFVFDDITVDARDKLLHYKLIIKLPGEWPGTGEIELFASDDGWATFVHSIGDEIRKKQISTIDRALQSIAKERGII